MKTYFWGLDIGGTKCACSIGLYDGNTMTILGKRRVPTTGTPEDVLTALLTETDALLSEFSFTYSSIAACGISCGGPLDPQSGIILSPPNLPGWDEVAVTDFIRDKTGVPAHLENDANACAVAEWQLGAGRGCRNMLFLTFGTGLGAGLILNGRLYSGTNGNAGEIGHIRLAEQGPVGYGKIGSFEGFCSGSGIAQIGMSLAREAFQRGENVSFCPSPEALSSINAKVIADCADAGDPLARRVYALSGQKLGEGLSLLVDILNPERIVIGSIFTRSQHLLYQACDDVMRRECLPLAYNVCKVVPAVLGEEIGDYAALSLALSKWKESASEKGGLS